MNPRYGIVQFALAMALPCKCHSFATIAASDIASAARAEVEQRSEGHVITQIGEIRDVKVPDSSKWTIVAEKVNHPLVNPRQKVLVSIKQNGAVLANRVVWFAVSKPVRALVYSQAYGKLIQGSSVALVFSTCDTLAREADVVDNQELISGMRLKRNVREGAPVLYSDFESMPDVTAGQSVEIESIRGSARILSGGKVVSEGRIGQSVFVIANNGESKILAKVVSDKRVVVEK